jgi:hypothetical protein
MTDPQGIAGPARAAPDPSEKKKPRTSGAQVWEESSQGETVVSWPIRALAMAAEMQQ